MIFLSHTHTDKPIVDIIAQKLAETFGREKIFYDSWSIQPGDGIIEQVNAALKNCKYFFFFVSKKSLQSKMVDIEWQNALYKSTREQIKIIPVKIDDCMMPLVLLQTMYIDIFGQGLETAARQIIDVVSGTNTYKPQLGFQNIRAYVTQKENVLVVEFRAEVFMEPHSHYAVLVDNPIDELSYKAINETQYESNFSDETLLVNGRNVKTALLLGKQSATSPRFPFIVEVTSKNQTIINFVGAMRIISYGKYEPVPIIMEVKK